MIDVDRYLGLDVDELARQAVVCLVDPARDNALVGTGFFIAPQLVLTCKHVSDRIAVLELRDARNRRLEMGHISVIESLQTGSGALDLALIELPEEIPVLPLPLCTEPFEAERLTGHAGAEKEHGYSGTYPLNLRYFGRATVQYCGQSKPPLDVFDLEGEGVRPGASGAPLLDASSRAVVAVIVGGNPNPAVQRSWAVPLSAVSSWRDLAQALAWNDGAIPRFGDAINAAAVRQLLVIHSDATRKGLEGQQRYSQERDVPREAWGEWLQGFLDSGKPVMAIVGPSNVGKSWMLSAFVIESARDRRNSALALLLKASSIVQSSPELSELLRKQLADSAGESHATLRDDSCIPGSTRMLQALQRAGVRLVVVIDGLNEAPDLHWFAGDWLRQAIGWARQHGVRLVLSCRPESWAIAAEIAELSEAHLHLPLTARNSDTASTASEWCFRLSDFSARESEVALQRYGLRPETGVGPHPLMYRLAELLGNVDPENSGRFRILNRYVDRQVKTVASRLQLGALGQRALRAALQKMADALPAAGEGAVPLDQALSIVGNEKTLEMLADEGLLEISAEHVRFRYDQLADVLRSVSEAQLGGFAEPEDRVLDKAEREQMLAAATIATLRFEHDDDDARYRLGLANLLQAIRNEHHFDMALEFATRLARSLPLARREHVEQIYSAIAAQPSWSSGGLRSIAEAPIPIAHRVRMLVNAPQPRMLERSGYPLRWKDWADPGRRASFVAETRMHDFYQTPQAHLFKLLQEHRAEVRPALLEFIRDERPIGNEASFGSMCSGLLFLDAANDFSSLFGLLLDDAQRAGEDNSSLLNEVLDGHPDRAREEILARLGAGDRRVRLVAALCWIHGNHREARTAAMVRQLFEEGVQSKTQFDSWLRQLAHCLWRDDPNYLAAWDVLMDRWHRYGSCNGSVPPERVSDTVSRIQRLGPRFADYALSHDESPLEAQRQFVDALRTFSRNNSDTTAFPLFLENRIDVLGETGLVEPWLELAREIIGKPSTEMRESLFFRAFHRAPRSGRWLELRDDFLQNLESQDELEKIARNLAASAEETEVWTSWMEKARRIDPELVDRKAWAEIHPDRRFALEIEPAKAAARMVDIWRKSALQSSTSREILRRLDAGEDLEALQKER